MTVTTLPPFTLLGLTVTATFEDLFHVVPEAWKRLRELARAPADTFGSMLEWGVEHGLVLGEGKIDRGYRFAEIEPHDLYVEIRD